MVATTSNSTNTECDSTNSGSTIVLIAKRVRFHSIYRDHSKSWLACHLVGKHSLYI